MDTRVDAARVEVDIALVERIVASSLAAAAPPIRVEVATVWAAYRIQCVDLGMSTTRPSKKVSKEDYKRLVAYAKAVRKTLQVINHQRESYFKTHPVIEHDFLVITYY